LSLIILVIVILGLQIAMYTSAKFEVQFRLAWTLTMGGVFYWIGAHLLVKGKNSSARVD
jgi:hypothetical protein